MCVDKGVMDADIRQPAHKYQRVNTRPLLKDLKVRAIKPRIPPLSDHTIPLAQVHLGHRQRRRRVVLQTMHILVPVHLAPEISARACLFLLANALPPRSRWCAQNRTPQPIAKKILAQRD